MAFEARDLSKEVGGRLLYRGLGFRVEEGRTLAVRGPSGAGKSQLLRQLADLDPELERSSRQSGQVRFRDRGPAEWGHCQWRAEVCRVPQVVPNLGGTPAEFEGRIAHLRVQHSREVDDSRALASRLGMGAETWDQPWSELSVGEAQRLLLAVMVSRRPGVLLLDEPTAALDARSIEAVEALLRGLTCIWVTHSEGQAERVADDVLDLEGKPDAD